MKPLVGIVMGSDSDVEVMEASAKALKEFGVPYEMVVAAHTTIPVIGVPIDSSALKGLDSILSTVQMPGGIPVATMANGKTN